MMAVRRNSTALVKLLLRAGGADAKLANSKGMTARSPCTRALRWHRGKLTLHEPPWRGIVRNLQYMYMRTTYVSIGTMACMLCTCVHVMNMTDCMYKHLHAFVARCVRCKHSDACMMLFMSLLRRLLNATYYVRTGM